MSDRVSETGAARPDVLGCFAACARMPERTELALVTVQDAALPSVEDAPVVVVVGAGTAGRAAQVVEVVAASLGVVPVVAVVDDELPAWVGPSTLVLVIDHGESSPATHDLVGHAAARGARLIATGAAGPLLALVAGHGGTSIALDTGTTVARLALGPLSVAALAVLDRLGFLPGVEPEIDRAVRQLHRRRTDLAQAAVDPARTLARRIGRTVPLITGGGAVGAVAAAHWKAQCNVNAKIPAFASALPALAHDEVAGWGQHGDVTRQVLTSVLLRTSGETPAIRTAFERLVPLLEESLAAVHEVEAAGEGPLAQLLDLAYLGDVVSLELAALERLDPGPAPALGTLLA